MKIDKLWLCSSGKYKCPYCQKEFTKKGICSHIIYSHLRDSNFTEYNNKIKDGVISPWSKGKNKFGNESLMSTSIKNKKYVEKIKESGQYKSHLTTYIQSEKGRMERSQQKKIFYKKNPEKHPNRLLANNRNKMSYPEKVAYDWLIANNVKFEHQKKIGRYYVDFFITDTKLIIEIDGQYWHDKDKDEKRDEIINKLGYKIIRIFAKENIHKRLSDIF